jgi:hypothetical protein
MVVWYQANVAEPVKFQIQPDPTLYGIDYRLTPPVPVARLGSIGLLDTRSEFLESTDRWWTEAEKGSWK